MNKILIIEDDTNLSEMYASQFTNKGFLVTVANDGNKGVETALNVKPEVILLDIIMPKVNGFEVLRRLKTEPELKDIPVLVYTNLGNKDADENRELAFSLGANDYLIKALNEPDAIVDRVRLLLKPKAADEDMKLAA